MDVLDDHGQRRFQIMRDVTQQIVGQLVFFLRQDEFLFLFLSKFVCCNVLCNQLYPSGVAFFVKDRLQCR